MKVNEDLIKQITEEIYRQLSSLSYMVPVGISGRHIHLCRADMDFLFGKGTELTPIKALGQPGQFACKETVTLRGPKGEFRNVRVLGPIRPKTQVEISLSDSFKLGVKAQVRLSGDLAGSPGITVVGPQGTLDLPTGVIVAKRHIHMEPWRAKLLGFENGQIVKVQAGDPAVRAMVFDSVVMRVSEDAGLEIHLDQDEANAAGLRNDELVKILT